MPYCVKNHISILAYSSLAQGLLTGKFAPDHRFDPQDNRAKNKLFQGEIYQRAQAALAQLKPIADRRNLALAWLIAQPQAQAIVGVRNATQATQNAAAASVQLSPEELAEIDAIGRTVTDHLDDSPILWNWG